jgi:hypothetical protein
MLSTQDPKKGMEKEKVSSQSNDDKNSLKIQQERQEQEEKAINRVLDDTKENIRKTISEQERRFLVIQKLLMIPKNRQ